MDDGPNKEIIEYKYLGLQQKSMNVLVCFLFVIFDDSTPNNKNLQDALLTLFRKRIMPR